VVIVQANTAPEPHKWPPRGDLTPEKLAENQLLARDRIIIENFFAKWKPLFGIVHDEYRGDERGVDE
jgi:hypothetical protein